MIMNSTKFFVGFGIFVLIFFFACFALELKRIESDKEKSELKFQLEKTKLELNILKNRTY